MNTLNQFAKKLIAASILIMLAINFSACSEDPVTPELENISGKWEGPFQHPAYDGGSVNLNILDNDGNLSGSFTMRLVKVYETRNFVQTYGGTITGAKVSNNNYIVNLEGPDFMWVCDLDLNSKNVTLSGDWESSQSSLSGTVSTTKQ
jgi:hypothetical protein